MTDAELDIRTVAPAGAVQKEVRHTRTWMVRWIVYAVIAIGYAAMSYTN